MPNVGLHFSATVVDQFGVKASTTVYSNPADTETLASLNAALTTWLTDLDAATDGAITSCEVRITPVLPGGLKAVTSTFVNQAANAFPGVLKMSVSGTQASFANKIPALAKACILNGKPDIAGATLSTYIALLTGSAQAYGSNENRPFTGIINAKIGENKHRKQMQQKTTT